MNDAYRIRELARLLLRDGHVDNEVDARLAAVRIIAASDTIRKQEREAEQAQRPCRTVGSRCRE